MFAINSHYIGLKLPTIKCDTPCECKPVGCQIEISQILWKNACVFLQREL